jgi:hypothetical protein
VGMENIDAPLQNMRANSIVTLNKDKNGYTTAVWGSWMRKLARTVGRKQVQLGVQQRGFRQLADVARNTERCQGRRQARNVVPRIRRYNAPTWQVVEASRAVSIAKSPLATKSASDNGEKGHRLPSCHVGAVPASSRGPI